MDPIVVLLVHSLLRTWPSVAIVRQVQMSNGALGRQDHHTDNTTGAAVPLDSLLQGTLHELDSLFLRHVFLPMSVTVTVDVS